MGPSGVPTNGACLGPISGACNCGGPFPREFIGFRVARNVEFCGKGRPFWRGPLKTRRKSPPLGGRVARRGQKGAKKTTCFYGRAEGVPRGRPDSRDCGAFLMFLRCFPVLLATEKTSHEITQGPFLVPRGQSPTPDPTQVLRPVPHNDLQITIVW